LHKLNKAAKLQQLTQPIFITNLEHYKKGISNIVQIEVIYIKFLLKGFRERVESPANPVGGECFFMEPTLEC